MDWLLAIKAREMDVKVVERGEGVGEAVMMAKLWGEFVEKKVATSKPVEEEEWMLLNLAQLKRLNGGMYANDGDFKELWMMHGRNSTTFDIQTHERMDGLTGLDYGRISTILTRIYRQQHLLYAEWYYHATK